MINGDLVKKVWIKIDGIDMFRMVKVIGFDRSLKKLSLIDDDGLWFTLSEDETYPVNPRNLIGSSDLISLSYHNEPEVVFNLEYRFNRKMIYTWCGIILIAINPYDDGLNCYDESHVDLYRSYTDFCLDPHIFSVAQDAFSAVQEHQEDHSIIISGESGAGKTVSVKHILTFVNRAMGRNFGNGLDSKLSAANYLLEAYGNAKTCKNTNSSRFGKYIDIRVKQSDIAQVKIRTFLLEKTRVSKRSSSESNFHIFYTLIKNDPNHILWSNYTNDFEERTACNHLIDLSEIFESFKRLEINDSIANSIISITRSLLHIGNIKPSEISTMSLATIAELLEINDESELKRSIQVRSINAGKETLYINRTDKSIQSTRDSLAQYLYMKLFDKIVRLINLSMEGVSTNNLCPSLGILDIFGFEIFDNNGFEQLCINYANERLQQSFYKRYFQTEQNEYIQQGLCFEVVVFRDNSKCIRALNGSDGLFNLLNDHLSLPKLSTNSLLDAIFTWNFTKAYGDVVSRVKGSHDRFEVEHYNGKVTYDVTDFLSRNEGCVCPDILSVIRKSKSAIVRELSTESVNRRVKQSIVQSFRRSLDELMDRLDKSVPHYVRCIKPNDDKATFSFVRSQVTSQLRACGIIDTLKLASIGYPSKFSYEDFNHRYGLLCSSKIRRTVDGRGICEQILKLASIVRPDFQTGETKLFLKQGVVARLEKCRKSIQDSAARLIQTRYRGFCERLYYTNLKRSCIALSRILKATNYPKAMIDAKSDIVLTNEAVESLYGRREVAKLMIVYNRSRQCNVSFDEINSFDVTSEGETMIPKSSMSSISTLSSSKCRYMIAIDLDDIDRIIRALIIELDLSQIESSINGGGPRIPITFPAYGIFMCLRYADKLGNYLLFKTMIQETIVTFSRMTEGKDINLLYLSYWLSVILHLYKLLDGKGTIKGKHAKIRQFNLNDIIAHFQKLIRSFLVSTYCQLEEFLNEKIIPYLTKQSKSVSGVPASAFQRNLDKLTKLFDYFQYTGMPDELISHFATKVLQHVNKTGLNLIYNCEKWRETHAAHICRLNTQKLECTLTDSSFIGELEAKEIVKPLADACKVLINLDHILRKRSFGSFGAISLTPSKLDALLLKSKLRLSDKQDARLFKLCEDLSMLELSKHRLTSEDKEADYRIAEHCNLMPINSIVVPELLLYHLQIV